MLKLQWNNFSKIDVYNAMKNGRLLTLTVLLEYKCNLKCSFCYTLTKPFRDQLSIEEWKVVILEAKALGVQTILIAGAGEPLMLPYIWDVFEFINRAGLKTILFSNLTLIGNSEAERLFDLEINVIGKLNSFNQETQEKIVGNVPGSFVKMQNGLKNLLNAGLNRDRGDGTTMLALETSVLPENLAELERIWIYCRTNNILPIIDTVLHEGNAKKQEYDKFLVDYDSLLEVLENLRQFDIKNYAHDWQIRLVKRHGNKGIIVGELDNQCHRIGTNLNVDSEGNVFDCFNMSKKPFGNVRRGGLGIILENRLAHGPNPILTHGLCDCRNLIDRKQVNAEVRACCGSRIEMPK